MIRLYNKIIYYPRKTKLIIDVCVAQIYPTSEDIPIESRQIQCFFLIVSNYPPAD